MASATVRLTVKVETEITDTGYLREASIQEHIRAAEGKVKGWQFQVIKDGSSGQPTILQPTVTVDAVVITP